MPKHSKRRRSTRASRAHAKKCVRPVCHDDGHKHVIKEPNLRILCGPCLDSGGTTLSHHNKQSCQDKHMLWVADKLEALYNDELTAYQRNVKEGRTDCVMPTKRPVNHANYLFMVNELGLDADNLLLQDDDYQANEPLARSDLPSLLRTTASVPTLSLVQVYDQLPALLKTEASSVSFDTSSDIIKAWKSGDVYFAAPYRVQLRVEKAIAETAMSWGFSPPPGYTVPEDDVAYTDGETGGDTKPKDGDETIGTLGTDDDTTVLSENEESFTPLRRNSSTKRRKTSQGHVPPIEDVLQRDDVKKHIDDEIKKGIQKGLQDEWDKLMKNGDVKRRIEAVTKKRVAARVKKIEEELNGTAQADILSQVEAKVEERWQNVTMDDMNKHKALQDFIDKGIKKGVSDHKVMHQKSEEDCRK